MSNKTATREAQQRATAAEQRSLQDRQIAETERVKAAELAQKQIVVPKETELVSQAATEDLAGARSGNLVNIRGVTNFLTGVNRARETAARSSPTGAAGLARPYANENLLSMNADMLKEQTSRDVAAGVDTIAKATEQEATGNLMNVSGIRAGVGSNLVNFMFDNVRSAQTAAGLSANASESAWERYKFEKSQKPFWQSALLAGIGGASQVAGAYFGKKA